MAALNDVSIAIEPGEVCCIVGQSGSGKSTLLNQLAGLEKPTSGQVFIGKREISAMSEGELAVFRQKYLGFIFQSYNLIPHQTILENVELALTISGMGKEERIEIMENIESYDVILTTYGTLKNDYEWYNDKEFDYCIIDEAQHIKNPQSISSETVKEIKAKVKFALTGTPIENNLLELWSIFDF